MLDEIKYNNVYEYLLYRKNCFNNYISYIPNKEYDKIINRRYCKVSRVRKKFLYLITHKKYYYFLTFTFDDNTIKKCDRTKKDLIKNTLFNFDDDIYIILNRDFGKQTEREHYHAIVGTNLKLNLKNYLDLVYPCFSYTENIRTDSKSIKKISKYINKLSNHCIKDSTKNFRMYYSFKGWSDNECDNYFYKLSKQLFMTH